MLQVQLDNLLILDIETVSRYPDYDQVPPNWQNLWEKKVAPYLPADETPEGFYPKRAAILAEFGKIVCISMAYFKNVDGETRLRVKSFSGDDEKLLLQNFINSVDQWNQVKKNMCFCGHNIKEFDLPYICRRLLVNGMGILPCLDFQSRKPWETNIADTLQFWKFGDYKNYISLNLLAACLDVPSPKDDIDGSMVGDVYWKEHDLPRIMHYCQKDVVTVAQVMLRMKNCPLLEENQVEAVP